MNNKEQLISIIVPVYNVEYQLERCLSSIKKQSYENIEVIMVDDCSADLSSRICKLFEESDSRFKYYKMPCNSGAGPTRQYGIGCAKGEIIGFVDGDDWVEEEFIAELYRNMVQTGSQISCCQYWRYYIDNKKCSRWPVSNELKVYGKNEATARMIKYEDIGAELWNKLYSKSVIEKAIIRDVPFEDSFVSMEYFMAAERICVYNMPLYYYFQRDGSLMNSRFSCEKEFYRFKLEATQAIMLRKLGFEDKRFGNKAIRKGLYVVKNFTLLERSKELKAYILEAKKMLWSVCNNCKKISLRNRIEVALVKSGNLYTGLYFLFSKIFCPSRKVYLQDKYENNTTFQIIRNNIK